MSGVKGMHQRASRSPSYAEAVRARIRAGGIAKRLEEHILGKVEMTASQVQAALGLLRLVVPQQANVEHTGKGGGPIEMTAIYYSNEHPALQLQTPTLSAPNPAGAGLRH